MILCIEKLVRAVMGKHCTKTSGPTKLMERGNITHVSLRIKRDGCPQKIARLALSFKLGSPALAKTPAGNSSELKLASEQQRNREGVALGT